MAPEELVAIDEARRAEDAVAFLTAAQVAGDVSDVEPSRESFARFLREGNAALPALPDGRIVAKPGSARRRQP